MRRPLPPTHATLAVLLLCASASVAPAKTPLVTERSPHFELTAGCDDVTRQRLVNHLESYHSALSVLVRAATGVELAPTPIRVLLYEEPSDYHQHVRQHAPALVHNGGYYDGASRTVVAHRRANPLQLHFHEIAHAALGDVFDDPDYKRYGRPGWPVWFDEGFAEYVSSFEVVPEGLKFGAPHLARIATLVDAIESRKTLSLSALLRGRSRDFTGRDMDLWYATAWGLVDLLLAEPDLRGQVPEWIGHLKGGADGMIAFREVFGQDLRALERRLYTRVRTLGTQPTVRRALAPRGKLEPWTAHDGGRWWTEGHDLIGHSTQRWSYLTTAVPMSRRFAMSLQVAPSPGSELGLVLGRHAAGAYPYHTIVSFDGREVIIRRVLGPERVVTVVRQPLLLAPQRWASVRLAVERSVLLVSVNGEDVVAARLDNPVSSLFGLYVERGTARFRDPIMGPTNRYPTGPAMPAPPKVSP